MIVQPTPGLTRDVADNRYLRVSNSITVKGFSKATASWCQRFYGKLENGDELIARFFVVFVTATSSTLGGGGAQACGFARSIGAHPVYSVPFNLVFGINNSSSSSDGSPWLGGSLTLDCRHNLAFVDFDLKLANGGATGTIDPNSVSVKIWRFDPRFS